MAPVPTQVPMQAMQMGDDTAQRDTTGVFEASISLLGLCHCSTFISEEIHICHASTASSGPPALSAHLVDDAEDEGDDGRLGGLVCDAGSSHSRHS